MTCMTHAKSSTESHLVMKSDFTRGSGTRGQGQGGMDKTHMVGLDGGLPFSYFLEYPLDLDAKQYTYFLFCRRKIGFKELENHCYVRTLWVNRCDEKFGFWY
ncbi:hypothetical protein BC938DRAFT_477314 [Jimgerdemannia flammicorona]|uniref:Uncharacterized protein n=1 Tax=Jimgerdemannia flammicorona TaxID=994334 RepID=A0A433QPI9_9FUNG|nr:hypothetical protein BC938DRAFT_477314 [Jimgerdemannia flammicorona]